MYINTATKVGKLMTKHYGHKLIQVRVYNTSTAFQQGKSIFIGNKEINIVIIFC